MIYDQCSGFWASTACTHAQTHTHTYARTHTHARTHAHTNTHTPTHARTHTRTLAHAHAHTHTHVLPHTHPRTCTHSNISIHANTINFTYTLTCTYRALMCHLCYLCYNETLEQYLVQVGQIQLQLNKSNDWLLTLFIENFGHQTKWLAERVLWAKLHDHNTLRLEPKLNHHEAINLTNFHSLPMRRVYIWYITRQWISTRASITVSRWTIHTYIFILQVVSRDYQKGAILIPELKKEYTWLWV